MTQLNNVPGNVNFRQVLCSHPNTVGMKVCGSDGFCPTCPFQDPPKVYSAHKDPPTIPEIRKASREYAEDQCKAIRNHASTIYASKDFIAGAEYVLQQIKP